LQIWCGYRTLVFSGRFEDDREGNALLHCFVY
jgi:hypothetical protein